jgi:hypothetical protein
MVVAGAYGCSDDDDSGADAGTDVDADGDVDGDADTDTDSDGDVDYNGTLFGAIWSYGIDVKTLNATDLSIGATVRWWVEDGPVNNVKVNEMRIYFPDDTDSDPFWTSPEPEDIIIPDVEFDGVVEVGPETHISYVYNSQSREGFDEHCDEDIEIEIDATYGDDNTPVDLAYEGSLAKVNCIEE